MDKMDKKEYYETNYNLNEIEVDPRFKVCEKEMKITFSIQLIYTFTIIAVAYFLGQGDPKGYMYILGMPAWWTIILAICLVFLGVIIYISQKVFVNMDLTDKGKVEDKESS